MASVKTFLRLLSFLRPFTGRICLSIVLGVVTIASNIGLLGTSAYLIARAALHPSIAVLQVAIVGVRFFGIARGVFRYLERLVSHSINFKLVGSLRLWFYQRLEPLVPAALYDTHSGDLLSRSVADIDTLQDFFVRVVAPPLTALVVVAAVGLFIGGYHLVLAGILLLGLALVGIGLPVLSSWLSRKAAGSLVNLRAQLAQSMVDGLQGLPDLEANDRAGGYLDQFREHNRYLGQAQRKLSSSGGLISGLTLLGVNFTLLTVLWFAIPLVTAGSINGVTLAVLALVTLASFEAVTPLGLAAQHLATSLRSAQRLFEIVDRSPVVSEPPAPIDPPRSPSLSVLGLGFNYPQDPAFALKNISFDLPQGKRIGILGPSGAGKSTLLNLLLRFWEYDQGQILLDGRDLKLYSPADVRSMIAVISQDTRLFTGTVRDNLLLACPSALDADLIHALDQAQLTAWLNALPHALDTWLGEQGAMMSGGERQRLALARALLRDAELYLLDEPASQLDPETENNLVHSLLQVTRGKSVLWVSHSLAGMAAMDEILVLQDGRIAERGSPVDLRHGQGIYARLAGTFIERPAS
jgi:ATP-binding cassette subfamily C protein CydC